MKTKKSDRMIIKEAEAQGRMAAMTSISTRNRTDKTAAMSKYFRDNLPKYDGVFDECESEDVLHNINEYITTSEIDTYLFDFPISSGTSVRLLPINDNVNLKVLIVDEYYGDGDYEKYVAAECFLVNEDTTEKDVDELIAFLKQHSLV